MKDAVLHTKTTFSKPLSWISYSKNYEIRQKRCLSSTYNNLYHYAGNNPVKYTDPNGCFDVDEETKTITADLSDKKDMKEAAKYFKTHDDYKMNGNSDNVSINFQSYSNVKDYIKQTSKLNKNDYQNLISSLSTIATEGQLFSYLGGFSNAYNAFCRF